MTAVQELTRLLGDLARCSPQQLAFRAGVVAATAGVLGLEALAGAPPGGVFSVVALALALVAAAMPDSSAPLFLVLMLGVHWALVVPEQLTGWILLAGVALLTLHVCAALASYGPPSLVLKGALLRLWWRRCAVLAAAMVLAWLAAKGLSVLHLPSSGLVLAAALVLLAAWTWLLGRRLS